VESKKIESEVGEVHLPRHSRRPSPVAAVAAASEDLRFWRSIFARIYLLVCLFFLFISRIV